VKLIRTLDVLVDSELSMPSVTEEYRAELNGSILRHCSDGLV